QYAINLSSKLEPNVGILTQYGMLPRQQYQPLILAQNADNRVDKTSCGANFFRQSESHFIREWSGSDFREPRLFVGPAGSGKSCLLESIALGMVERIQLQDGLPARAHVPHVPLIIPLSRVGDCSLEEYLLRAEQDVTKR